MSIRDYLDDAIRTGKTVTIKYIKYEGEFSTRQISDISYSEEFGSDYIRAFCHLRNEDRTFKISRIVSVDGVTNSPSVSSDAVRTQKTAYTGNSAQTGPSRANSSTPSYDNLTSYSKPSYSSTSKPSYSSSGSKKSEGCYIATMAYGDYDHPKVMVLRNYRDNVLSKSIGGRLFITFYYWLSPKLVKVLQGHDKINSFIRSMLDQIVIKVS